MQLTGTLRHVSSCERTFPLLLVTGAVPQVCNLLQHFSHDADVTANVVRILRCVECVFEYGYGYTFMPIVYVKMLLFTTMKNIIYV